MKKKKEIKKEIGCSCEKCTQCCSNSCGWFGSLNEVKDAAKIMKMSLPDFAKEYLIEEYWSGSGDEGGDVSVIAPRKDFKRCKNNFVFEDDKIRNGKGFKRATWGHNLITGVPCIFLSKDNKCKIHESKPQECRESFGCEKGEGEKNKNDGMERRKKIVKYWRKHQNFILCLKRDTWRNQYGVIENGYMD
jgi:Fe-S-cluster containining protein